MNKQNSRRSFFATLALGVSASAFPMMVKEFEKMESIPEINHIDRKDSDDWFKKIKGSHRIAYDGSTPHQTLPIVWNWAFYQSNNQTGSPDSDITAMTVLRHTAIPYAFNSDIWKKYPIGKIFGINDNSTGEPSLRNTVYEPQPGDLPLPQVEGIKRLQQRGALFCVCNLAINVYSGVIANQMQIEPKEVYNDIIAGILPEIQLVPSGVWALGRAQENGCGYIFAGN
ncbi:MAG: Tat (twin-arginine translocation) pathway signal sequence containing protein [Flavobacteriaceae bacterium]|nr:Tat (twin-arginine translocation) pathway signal sequence containing protein [Flavobacteriaceae bacterium]|tara:strand:- start:5793 stop:6473 length:681 start_codon:yes stop_codon:yes gene_type:complete